MNPRLVAHLATTGGLVRRCDALDLGVSPTAITGFLRRGEWVVVHRGVYGDAEVFDALDPWRGQPLMRAKAAVLAMRRGWVLSHDSSAHALELEMLAPEEPHAHITRPGFTNAWTKGRVKHHLARYRTEQVVDCGGWPALDMARTVCDVAREHGLRAGLVTADSAMRKGVSRGEIYEAADMMRHWPWVTIVRQTADLADPRAENGVESLAREFVIGLGIGPVDAQFPLRIQPDRVVWCDLRVGNHVFEVHGLIKVLTPAQGGVADREARTVLFEERKRERLVTAEGLGVTNLYYEDFFGAARRLAAKRAIDDWNETVRRHGPELHPHLARNAAELRERLGRRDAS